MCKSIVYSIAFFFNAFCLNAQIDNNWYFSEFAGLRFNNMATPTPLLNGRISSNANFGAGTISDFNGNLLFYTDGDTTYNRNHQVMQNGFPNFFLGGAGGQSCFIVKSPATDNKYFIFKSSGPNNVDSGYLYSVVDMDLDNGFGAVIVKNKQLTLGGCERFTALPHANGIDFWLVTRLSNGNTFKTFKVTCQGVQENNPIVQNIGTIFTINDFNIGIGNMKSSPQGNKIVFNFGWDNRFFEVINFDNATGLLSNPIKLITPGGFPYGVGFSPNGKLVYVNIDSNQAYPFARRLLQYKVDIMDSVAINSSRILLDSTNAAFGQFQIGPNNKLYVCSDNEISYLSEVSNPNVYGVGSNFIVNSVFLGGRRHVLNLPYFLPSQTSGANTQFSYTVNPDCRTVNFTGKTYIKGSNLAFKWKFTPTDSITQNVPSSGDTTFANTVFTFPPGIDSFNVQLFVTSDTVCGLGRAGKLVVVKPPPPKANFGYSNTCNNLNVIFTDSSLLNFNPSLTYVYAYKPALAPASAYVNFAVMANTNFIFPSFDSFDVRLIVRSPLSCVQQDTLVKRIVLSPKPIASFTYNNNCGSHNVAITNTATIAAGSISSYQYFLNGAATSNSANYIFNVPNFGAYNLQQVVTSSAGCVSDTFSFPIIVKAKPTINVTTLKDSVCQNNNYTLTANATVDASTITNYTWLKNNTVIVNNTNTQTENNTTGVYTYKIVAQAATGCNSDTATKTITVASKPTITLNATNNCGSKQINIASTANVINDNITQYFINYGDGNSSNIDPNSTNYTYANFGTYTLKYVASGSAGCTSDTAYFTIAVKDKPITTISYNNACQNTNYILNANATVNASTITNYTWLKNNILQSNNTNNLTENNSAGTYVYQLIANAANGCKSDTLTKNIIVEQYPTVNFNAINGCTNTNVLITNNSINNNTSPSSSLQYLWATNDGQISNNATPNFSFNNAGTKTITLKASTANNCADSATKNITIEDNPTANFTITEACLGKPITVNNTSTGAITNYAWATNNGQSSNALIPNFIFNTQGNYTLTLNTNTLNNCTANKTENIIIQAVQLFTTPAVDTNIIINQPLQLNISGAANYTWLPPLNLNSNSISNPIFTATAAGTTNYQIEGITAQGCKGNASLKVNVFAANNYILIPNAFTPNADGLNDRLRITCTGLQKLNNFTIYNRWGNMVYTQNNCNQNGWDGKLLGVLQPNATFVYNWSGIDFMGKKVNGKGTVTLIR